jgi:hypothetical protein
MAKFNPSGGMFKMIVERAVFLVRLSHMRGHVSQHVTHMIVGNVIKDLTTAPDTTHQSRRLEQTQMVARQLWRQTGSFGRRRSRQCASAQGDDETEARGITQQPEHVGELMNVGRVEAAHIKHFNIYLIVWCVKVKGNVSACTYSTNHLLGLSAGKVVL